MRYCRVLQVGEVDLTYVSEDWSDIVITAHGRTSTCCWTDPQLSQWIHVVPPKDGIQEFDFVARRPGGLVFPALTPIVGQGVMKDVDFPNFWGPGRPLVGIRVHGTNNSVEHIFAGMGATDEVERVAV